jgi:hypothetical protein
MLKSGIGRPSRIARVPAKAQAQMMADKTGGSRDEYVHRLIGTIHCLF